MNDRHHITPINDTKKHNTDSPNCWCQPAIELGLVIHNAADGREFFEELDEEEKQAIQAGLEDVAAGRLRKWEDVRRSP